MGKPKPQVAIATEADAGTAERIEVGSFSKRDAAGLIVSGVKHLHSTALGRRDAGVTATERSLEAGTLARYPWEPRTGAKRLWLEHSEERHGAIKQILTEHGAVLRRDGREKVQSVLEELTTNAIYHTYRNPDGSPKYIRKNAVQVLPTERVELLYHGTREGLFLAVRDRAGIFPFQAITGTLERCYGEPAHQIEDKATGAGLGLYMVYEAVTHLRIVNVQNQFCEMSCWIAGKRQYDPQVFSFNFFDWR